MEWINVRVHKVLSTNFKDFRDVDCYVQNSSLIISLYILFSSHPFISLLAFSIFFNLISLLILSNNDQLTLRLFLLRDSYGQKYYDLEEDDDVQIDL